MMSQNDCAPRSSSSAFSSGSICSLTGTLLLLVWAAGCNGSPPSTAPAGGRVTYNGEPVANAVVVFHPEEGRPATGRTDDQGAFSLSTFKEDDGALVSNHTVTVVVDSPAIDSSEISAQAQTGTTQSPIPTTYANRETSQLTAIVKEGETNDFELELTD
ncbi:hypothetical protein Mal4_53330 [Maioricimonas rarisocia]|uniref:Carboxypeptidase regulatory-like domain-containing protein n=1 Tax=Maioricimonas rarisocia TaxID=2528026 RepID=A0A517ZER4_9PLAN|nr:hypothetical protein [Maioricimonas rarisocia]QDU40970.1 hypothetical protein Mal4_53330 [Maioricimonas rarisocia]